MDLVYRIVEEIKARENNEYATMENLTDVELYALAHKLGIVT